jgi:hypothetical protein
MKKSFVLYNDQLEIFEALSDRECKELILAIFNYDSVDTGTLSPTVKVVFITFKNQLIRDEIKWQKIVVRNRKNGKLGGRPRLSKSIPKKPKKPIGLSGNPKNPDNDNVNDNGINTTASVEYLKQWNETFKKNYTSTIAIEPNLIYWLKVYSIDQIKEAIPKIKQDPYWKDKDLSPEWLLRTKEKNEPVDRIGRMLNSKQIILNGLNRESISYETFKSSLQ